jgi:lipoate---protein ligase
MLDEDLLELVRAEDTWAYRSWEPQACLVVLGRGNHAALEVYEERCQREQVPILRRRGGGGTVVLSPGVLVVSLAKRVQHQFYIQEYFRQINDYIIDALQSLGIQDLAHEGHSDICIRDRKILGSSMYRSKALLFYTASLLVANDLTLISQYLKHPTTEPEYRQGRAHHEFLTTITQEYPALTLAIVQNRIDQALQRRIPEIK